MIGYANGDELDNMLDDRTAVLSPGKTSFHTVPVYRLIRAALAQPSGKVVVTKNESGAIVSVTRQDEDGRVLSVIAEAQSSPAQAEQAEAERPEVVASVVHSNPVVLGQCGPLNANDELMTVAQHAASVARWAEMFNRVEQQRDAALAEVERLRGSKGDPVGSFEKCMKVMYERDENAKRLEVALARVAELEKELGDSEKRGSELAASYCDGVVGDEYGHAYCHYKSERDAALASFKNFHRLLCERFGYTHDEKDWQRDQLSLIEHIAVAQAQHSVPGEFIGRLSEFLAQRGATGKALLRELRAMLAAAPGKEGV
ncbi:TPA: hypothetical protein ACHIU4_004690 [Pseudomonas aeruginosa]